RTSRSLLVICASSRLVRRARAERGGELITDGAGDVTESGQSRYLCCSRSSTMRIAVLCVAIAIIASTFDIHAEQARQRRKAPAPKTATFAILVTDPAGDQIP